MSEKKITLSSLKNQDWKILKVESEKNKRIINTYLNELHQLIYAGRKLVGHKTRVSLKKTNRNSKSGGKIRLETQIRDLL